MNLVSAPAVSLPSAPVTPPAKDDSKLRETFRQFVGETVFGQMLASMRNSIKPVPYFHGGRGEEVFQKQLDQELAQQLAKSSSDRLADPMFDLFMLQRG